MMNPPETLGARIERNARLGAGVRLVMTTLFATITIASSLRPGSAYLRPFAALYVGFAGTALLLAVLVRRVRSLRLRQFWLLPFLDIPVITVERWLFLPHAKMPGGVGLIALSFFLCFIALSLLSLDRRVVLCTTFMGAAAALLLLLRGHVVPVLIPSGIVTLLLTGVATYAALSQMLALLDREAEQGRVLRRLLSDLEAAREDERVRISRELHDELGAELSALGYAVGLARQRVQGSGDGRLQSIAPNLAEIDAQLSRTRAAVRTLLSGLRPLLLDTLGLQQALEWLVVQARARMGLPIELTFIGDGGRVGSAEAGAVFRVLQEALTNAAKHARARRVTAAVRIEQELELCVADDGVGLTQDAIGRGAGLLGMRERARALGGDLEISGSAGAGTRLLLRLPLVPARAQGEPS